MSRVQQTTVLASAAAFAALDALTKASGKSRDAVVRVLLERYVAAQNQLASKRPDRRLTHIGTVLHYPSCLNQPGRGPEKVRLRRLPFRAPPPLQNAARSHAYRIPGHLPGRGHHDYSSRLLGDAIATAISLEHPFVEPELEGLPPTLEHGVADVLWQLTKAATMTHTDRVDLQRQTRTKPGADKVAIDEARNQAFVSPAVLDYMWHSPERSAVALALARTYLSDPTEENLSILTGQGQDFEIEIAHLLHSSPGLVGSEETGPGIVSNAEGRAASRLWVRGRAEAHQDLAQWMTNTPDAHRQSRIIDPPGWTLGWRPEWRSRQFGHQETVPARLQADLNAGRVLQITSGSRSAIWPLQDPNAPTPIPRFDHVIAGMRTARPTATPAEILEACLTGPPEDTDDPDVQIEDTSGPLYLLLDLDEAHELALIDTRELHALKAANLTENQAAFAKVMHRPTRGIGGERLSPHQIRELRTAAATDPKAFFALARRIDLHIDPSVRLRYPLWEWPIADLHTAIELYDGPALVAFARCRMEATQVALHPSKTHAWFKAMWWAWGQRGDGDDADV